jgi:acyl-coenzyme A synthetase/AMP-(fatty) acid ligase
MIARLRDVAARRANYPAIIDDEGSLSYAQLRRAVDRLAATIERHPAAAGPVGIVLPIGRAYVVAAFACIAARRLAVMLDAGHPRARNVAIAAATGITLALVDRPDQAQALDLPTIEVDLAEPAAAAPDPEMTDTRAMFDLDAPAFILCTSGSTGLPKAIVHSQRNLLHMARTGHDAFHFDDDDRLLALSSPSALGGLAPLLHVPLAGATLHLLNLKARGISGLLGDLQNFPISILGAAPSLLRGLARLPVATRAFAGLRIVQTYGEPLTKDDVRILRGVLPAACFIRNGYASTEAGGLTWYAQEDDQHDPLQIAAGCVLPDCAAAVIDHNGANCAAGEVGELWLRSRYAALGEYVDGQLVPGRLQPDPDDPTQRIYRTGDLARHDDAGVFVVLGRADRMINVNGQRTEPAEIETVLRRHPQVDKAEVIVQQRQQGPFLTAFVVARPGSADGLEISLRASLRQSLPSFMVPARIVLLEQLPLLPGGKVDAQALRALTGGA